MLSAAYKSVVLWLCLTEISTGFPPKSVLKVWWKSADSAEILSCLFCSVCHSILDCGVSSDWKFTEVSSSSPLDLMTEPNQSDQSPYGWGSVVRACTSVPGSARNMSGWWLNDCHILTFQCNHVALFLTKTGFRNPPSLLETRRRGRFCSCLRFFSFEVQFLRLVCCIVPSNYSNVPVLQFAGPVTSD